MLRFSFCAVHTFLLWLRVIVRMRFLLRVSSFLDLIPYLFLLYTLILPHRLVAVSDALSDMGNIHLLLLPFLHCGVILHIAIACKVWDK
jgi:hypothetical protein